MHLIFNKQLCLNDSFFVKIRWHGAELKIGIGNNINLKICTLRATLSLWVYIPLSWVLFRSLTTTPCIKYAKCSAFRKHKYWTHALRKFSIFISLRESNCVIIFISYCNLPFVFTALAYYCSGVSLVYFAMFFSWTTIWIHSYRHTACRKQGL